MEEGQREQYEDIITQLQLQQRGGFSQSSPSMFSGESNENLVRWQLDVKEELERIEHLLRKHIPKVDTEGNIYYAEPKPEDVLLNETGVNEILNLLSWYLSKNIILSNFDEKTINLRCLQFGQYLKDFIFNNYENFGLNTKEKIKHYPILVMNILNTIEASYRRAMNAGERTNLRTARQVSQVEPIMNSMNFAGMGNSSGNKKFNLLKPTTWK